MPPVPVSGNKKPTSPTIITSLNVPGTLCVLCFVAVTMPSTSETLLADMDPAIRGDIIMRKYRALPWPKLRNTDFRPKSPNLSLEGDIRPTQIKDETAAGPSEGPISPIRRSPSPALRTLSPPETCNSPRRHDLNRTAVHRPNSVPAPAASFQTDRISPNNTGYVRSSRNTPLSPNRLIVGRTSPTRAQSGVTDGLSPDVTLISRRIFDNIDEIRKEISLTSEDAKYTSTPASKYKYQAERDKPSSRDSSPTKRRRNLSPTPLNFTTEDSPSTRAFRTDLEKRGRTQPQSPCIGTVSPVKKVEFSETLRDTGPKSASVTATRTAQSATSNSTVLGTKVDKIDKIEG